jgi:hypothetical protein
MLAGVSLIFSKNVYRGYAMEKFGNEDGNQSFPRPNHRLLLANPKIRGNETAAN